MHIIGFSHHYTKLHGQTCGLLLSVSSTKPLGSRPSRLGINYDTEYTVSTSEPSSLPRTQKGYASDLLSPQDFDKPLLQLVFLGSEHQIPFTTYRELPKDYIPLSPGRRTYRKSLPYSDLIGDLFAFKFKGEPLPQNLQATLAISKEPKCKIFS